MLKKHSQWTLSHLTIKVTSEARPSLIIWESSGSLEMKLEPQPEPLIHVLALVKEGISCLCSINGNL